MSNFRASINFSGEICFSKILILLLIPSKVCTSSLQLGMRPGKIAKSWGQMWSNWTQFWVNWAGKLFLPRPQVLFRLFENFEVCFALLQQFPALTSWGLDRVNNLWVSIIYNQNKYSGGEEIMFKVRSTNLSRSVVSGILSFRRDVKVPTLNSP